MKFLFRDTCALTSWGDNALGGLKASFLCGHSMGGDYNGVALRDACLDSRLKFLPPGTNGP